MASKMAYELSRKQTAKAHGHYRTKRMHPCLRTARVAIVYELNLQHVEGADWLVQLGNTDWFGSPTPAQPSVP